MSSLKVEMAINFILGGIILSCITYLVKYVKPEIGSIVWAAPVLLIPSVILLWFYNVNDTKIANLVYSCMPNVLLIISWQIFFLTMFTYFKLGVLVSCIISLGLWLLLALTFYKLNIYKHFTI